MNIKKLFYLFFISFCLQAPADSSSGGDFVQDFYPCNNKFIPQNKLFECSQKSKEDYLNNLRLFESHLESIDNLGPPNCPIPLPQFNAWMEQYRSFCSVEEDLNLKDQISSVLKDKPEDLPCPIPLPYFSQLVEEYKSLCLQNLNQFPKLPELDSEAEPSSPSELEPSELDNQAEQSSYPSSRSRNPPNLPLLE